MKAPLPPSEELPGHTDANRRQVQDIGWAVKQLWNGARVRRSGWNGKGMFLQLIGAKDYSLGVPGYVALLAPDVGLAPWVGMKTADNKFVPWLASQTDLLAIDWEIAA